jgi:hypothetical protein
VARNGVPIDVERIVMRTLAKDPALRPTMAELARDLGDIVDAMSATTTMPMAMAV